MKQVLLVTASSRGIGAAICRRAAQNGYDIAVNHRDSREDAEKLVGELNEIGARARAFQADVSRETEVIALFKSIDADLGPVTALVNNAGGAAVGTADGKSLLADVSGESMHDVIALNLMSSIYCCRGQSGECRLNEVVRAAQLSTLPPTAEGAVVRQCDETVRPDWSFTPHQKPAPTV